MIKIVTDSTCYLPPEYVTEYDILLVPLKIQLGAETFVETTIDNDDFYQRLAATTEFPTTSQPSVDAFKDAYQKILARNPAAEILVLTISRKLSGTHNAAVAAAAQLTTARITVFDTLSAAMGVGLMIMAAVRMAVNGRGLAEILARLVQMRRELAIFFMVDTLEYLKRGGRLGAATAFLGGLLDTKPILAVVDGEIKPVGQVRTKKRAICRLLTELEQKLPAPNQLVQAGVMHVTAQAEAETLGEMMRQHFNITYFFIFELGPAVGAHLGPGTLAAGVCPESA
ncbi:MAG: DegV family protein [Anaerolineae bacterium]|nr:DegV family protein [Anaerolineae bacterium]